jgi:hypothetical protein
MSEYYYTLILLFIKTAGSLIKDSSVATLICIASNSFTNVQISKLNLTRDLTCSAAKARAHLDISTQHVSGTFTPYLLITLKL